MALLIWGGSPDYWGFLPIIVGKETYLIPYDKDIFLYCMQSRIFTVDALFLPSIQAV